jgi:hypothetical protein
VEIGGKEFYLVRRAQVLVRAIYNTHGTGALHSELRVSIWQKGKVVIVYIPFSNTYSLTVDERLVVPVSYPELA